MVTKKGQNVINQITQALEVNPAGLSITTLHSILRISRNTLYRYLNMLEEQNVLLLQENHLWKLKESSKAKTIFGHQYQAVFHGLSKIGGQEWDISTEIGQKHFKNLGKAIYDEMKIPKINAEELKKQSHHLQNLFQYAMRLIQEAGTVERFNIESKLDKEGFPDPETRLAAIVTFEGGYVASEPVRGNGFAHYYILAGEFEVFANEIISLLYGGRTIVKVLKKDEENQIVDLAIYVIFDAKTPYIDPKTGQKRVFS